MDWTQSLTLRLSRLIRPLKVVMAGSFLTSLLVLVAPWETQLVVDLVVLLLALLLAALALYLGLKVLLILLKPVDEQTRT